MFGIKKQDGHGLTRIIIDTAARYMQCTSGAALEIETTSDHLPDILYKRLPVLDSKTFPSMALYVPVK